MAKRKKYPRLPNGYGSIKYLGKGRRNPYGVYLPVTEFTPDGAPVNRKALCYVPDWTIGFAVLTAYKAGTYKPGMELELATNLTTSQALEADKLVQRILSDYNQLRGIADTDTPTKLTFSDVYAAFYEYKYERDKSRTYSSATLYTTKAAYKNCAALHNMIFSAIRLPDMQSVLDQCTLKHASLELIVSLLHQMYDYAIAYEIVDKDYSASLKINRPEDDEHGVPFSADELKILWEHQENDVAAFLLIMCYSGYRIKAYKTMEINLDKGYFCGGVKTKSSKNRIVPIHSAILPLVQRRIKQYGCILSISETHFRTNMYAFLSSVGIQKHTPHDCRHTFSALCEQYGVRENDRKRMLGHSFGSDITNGIYGHRSLEELRLEIEKIKI